MNRFLMIVILLAMTGCASHAQRYVTDVSDPGEEVDRLMASHLSNTSQGLTCSGAYGNQAYQDCDGLFRRLSQVYTAFPDNERVSMALALVGYQSGRKQQAGFILDQLLASDRPRPEAAVLRARMALETGNVSRARAILETQSQLNPMHPELHEILAATHFVNRRYPDSLSALALAESLGAPSWRVAYHRGLVFEARKNVSAACEQYVESYRLNPGFHGPKGRLMALTADPLCFELARFVGRKG